MTQVTHGKQVADAAWLSAALRVCIYLAIPQRPCTWSTTTPRATLRAIRHNRQPSPTTHSDTQHRERETHFFMECVLLLSGLMLGLSMFRPMCCGGHLSPGFGGQ